MGADPTVVRRVAGTASVVLLLALLAVFLDARFTTSGAYEVDAELGRAGAGLGSGSDVKLRGVNVGEVSDVHISDDGEVTARLEIGGEHRLPDDVAPVVTPKTFLGEKQVELRTDRELSPPYLEAGAVLTVAPGEQPVEPVAVVDQLGVLVREVDDDKLAALIDALAAFDTDDADLFAEGIDAGGELAAFLDRTAPDQLDRLGDAARAFDALTAAGDDLTRLAHELPDGVAPLVDNRAALTATLDSIDGFTRTVGEYLRVEEETFAALLATGDAVGEVLDPRLGEIGSMVHGVYRYALMFGQQGGALDDGTEFANFRVFLGEAGELLTLCEQLPGELAAVAPGCSAGGGA